MIIIAVNLRIENWNTWRIPARIDTLVWNLMSLPTITRIPSMSQIVGYHFNEISLPTQPPSRCSRRHLAQLHELARKP